jgi:hypothetical protein
MESETMQKRHRFKQIQSLEKRLAEEAKRLREQAELLPHGNQRDAVENRARQAETGSHISDWLRSPGLRAPQ